MSKNVRESQLDRRLTMEEKIAVLLFERGAYAICALDPWDCLTNNPRLTPEPGRAFFSDVLGFPFLEFYHSEDVEERSKRITMGDHFEEDTWHFGDVLESILWNAIKDPKVIINEQLVLDLETKIKESYEKFMLLTEPESKNSTNYIPSGIEMNGEILYRKVSGDNALDETAIS